MRMKDERVPKKALKGYQRTGMLGDVEIQELESVGRG